MRKTMTFRSDDGYEEAMERKFDELWEEGLIKNGRPISPDSPLAPKPTPVKKGGKVDDETYEAEAFVKQATNKALLCEIEGDEYWIPLSQIRHGGDVTPDSGKGDEGTIIMTQWIAEQKGLV
jgi:hypothetical protein